MQMRADGAFSKTLATVRRVESSMDADALQTAQGTGATPSSETIVVQPGQCLTRICAERFQALGQNPSRKDMLAAIHDVAQTNHLADPNRIYAGQRLDLAALTSIAKTQEDASASSSSADSGSWKAIVGGRLSSSYGWRRDPFTGQVHQHGGIDISAPAGTPIHAYASGKVVYAGWRPGYGNTVILQHENGLESIYAHASKLMVKTGDQVDAQTAIACVGSTGRSTGSHLHLEIRQDGRTVNPLAMLDSAPLQIAQIDTGQP